MFKTLNLPSIFSSLPVFVTGRPVSPRRAVRPALKSSAASTSSRLCLIASYAFIALNAGLLISYFIGVNSSTSVGYEIKSLQARISVLNEENRALTLKVSEKNSMAVLQTEIASSSFVPTGNTMYVQANKYTKR